MFDARAAAATGVWALGLNAYPRSLRGLNLAEGSAIAAVLADEFSQVRRIGVFVNATPAVIRETSQAWQLHYVQLHGDETPEIAAELAELRIWKVIRIVNQNWEVVQATLAAWQAVGCSDFLFDAGSTEAFGGTGKSLDWGRFREEIEAWRAKNRGSAQPVRVWLAGGLTPENVAAAIAQGRPDGVDVASGVEGLPGKKDNSKMQAFVQAAKFARN